MAKTIRIRSTARPVSKGTVRVTTTVSGGGRTSTTTKTIRTK